MALPCKEFLISGNARTVNDRTMATIFRQYDKIFLYCGFMLRLFPAGKTSNILIKKAARLTGSLQNKERHIIIICKYSTSLFRPRSRKTA